MNDDYFTTLYYASDDLTSEINQFIYTNQDHFFISKLGQNRIDFDPVIMKKIRKEFPFFLISDGGVFKNPPGWTYPIHKDARRYFAINMLLSDENSDFEALSYSEDLKISWPIPYVKNKWLLLNTKKFHSVKNNSQCTDRYTVSIGCSNMDYFTFKTTIEKNLLN